MAFLTLKNVKNQPELTGKTVQLRDGSTATGQWTVQDLEHLPCFRVNPESLELNYSQKVEELRTQAVIIEALTSKPELNGLPAQCGSYLAHKQRWKVAVQDSTILLRSQSLTLAKTGARMQDPIIVAECPHLQAQMGLFAASDLRAGQIIFEEDPFITAPSAENWLKQAKSYAKTFLAANESQQREALAMYANSSLRVLEGSQGKGQWIRRENRDEVLKGLGMDKSIDTGKHADVWKFMRVMQANAFQMNNQTEGLFSTLCRCNHSCSPNAMRYDNGSGKTLIALRDISKGEEILINYASDMQLLVPREMRRDTFKTWGFDCRCSRCSQQVDDMRSFVCPKKCGGHCVLSGDNVLSACTVCESERSRGSAQKMLQKEASIVDGVMQLDRNPRLIGPNPGRMEALFLEAESVLSPMHWAVARLHDLAGPYYQQTQDLTKAVQHMSSELSFLENHVTRASQQKAWKRKLRADVFMSQGNFQTAFEEYTRSLEEFLMVAPSQCHHCETLRQKLQEVLMLRPESAGARQQPPCAQQ